MNERSILSVVDAQPVEPRQRRVAGAEVVDGELQPAPVQLPQDRRDRWVSRIMVDSVTSTIIRLGLARTSRRWTARRASRWAARTAGGRLIDTYRSSPSLAPPGGWRQPAHHPLPIGPIRPVRSASGTNGRGWSPMLVVEPAQQRLGARSSSRGEVDQRLVVERGLGVHRAAQARRQREVGGRVVTSPA